MRRKGQGMAGTGQLLPVIAFVDSLLSGKRASKVNVEIIP
jgi:hypothetical protein